jgi:hypothetical protein
MTTLELANEALRKAVETRLATGSYDEYVPEDGPATTVTGPLAGCQPAQEAAARVLSQAWAEPSCCEGKPPRGPSAAEVIKRFAPERQFYTGEAARHPSSTAFVALLQEMKQLHESKSADYGSEDDPLANVRSGADFVNIEPWRGCMVRIADKVQRLRTYCRTGRLVHEGVRDTLLDLAAYSLLAIVLFDEGQRDA